MELDHIFVFIDNHETAEAIGQALKLTETYRRRRPGQGTSNICYCFDNAYLELLVMDTPEEARAPDILRTGLFARAQWPRLGTCPLGIAWRLDFGEAQSHVATWPYRPAYLPTGQQIPVATESDDPLGPMLFQSPGTQAPADWPNERRGDLQNKAGFRRIVRAIISYPATYLPGPTLQHIARKTNVTLRPGGDGWRLSLQVSRLDGGVAELPVLAGESDLAGCRG